jgi:hypothetical protein
VIGRSLQGKLLGGWILMGSSSRANNRWLVVGRSVYLQGSKSPDRKARLALRYLNLRSKILQCKEGT